MYKSGSNVYIMDRPEKQSDPLKITKSKTYVDPIETKKLYEESFRDLFLNSKKTISKRQQTRCVLTILPTIAMLIYHEHPNLAGSVIDAFYEGADQDLKDKFESFPDHESAFHFIMELALKSLLIDIEKVGYIEAINIHKELYNRLWFIYSSLPLMYIFSMIDSLES